MDIPVIDIFPNPNNPRLIFDPKDLDDLKESIRNAGVLVPVTVYQDDTVGIGKYVLLDGERRWRCAKELNEKIIPANIVDRPKDVTQNILWMFNIHYFRQQWELFPTALKLEKIIELLKTDKDSVLSSTTGLNLTTVKRCKILLWFPEKYREMLLYKTGKVSTDFFIEFYPIAKRLKEDRDFDNDLKLSTAVDIIINKFNNNVFSDVKEFRELRKALTFYEQKDQFFIFKEIFQDFIKTIDCSLDVFVVSDVETEKIKSNVLKNASYLINTLTNNSAELFSDLYVIDQLTLLRKKIDETILNVE